MNATLPNAITLRTMKIKALLYYLFQRNMNRQADTAPAPGIDFNRYLGRWYELARFNNPFEEGLEEVFTEYTPRADGNINICNYGIDSKHHQHSAKAIGTPSAPGQMDVGFLPLLPFMTTPYNILYVDDGYSTAVVSNDSGSCLWFLSRTATLESTTMEQLKTIALARGFNLSELHYTQHRYRD